MMLDQISENLQYLLKDETRAYAFLATLMPDGTPQLTPIWFNVDGDHILINSAQGRVKDRNIRSNPNIALVIMDLAVPLEYIQIRGEVVEISTDGAEDHINALSHKYQGKDWDIPAGQIRVKYRIAPQSIS